MEKDDQRQWIVLSCGIRNEEPVWVSKIARNRISDGIGGEALSLFEGSNIYCDPGRAPISGSVAMHAKALYPDSSVD